MTLNNRIAGAVIALIDLFYPRWIEKIIPRHTFRYGVCGVGNSIILDTIFYFLIYNYILCQRPIELGFYTLSPQVAAFVLVFPITFLIGFWLNRNVAFQAIEEAEKRQISKYALTVCGSILLSYSTLRFLVEVCGLWATPAKSLSSIIVALYSYLAARYFTFRKK
ncbi:MAG: GtrA family protein [Rikenellaceae bacterium]